MMDKKKPAKCAGFFISARPADRGKNFAAFYQTVIESDAGTWR
jgi:hypothetical protein